MNKQATIKKPIQLQGIGLHTGKRVQLELLPAVENHGIQFLRIDITNAKPIRASVENITSTTRATSLSNENSRVTTVEHLLSALYALGVDNLLCKMDAEEIPVLDGSSLPFVVALKKAGIQKQKAPKRVLHLLKPVEIRDGDKVARIEPARNFSVEYSIHFDHPEIGTQNFLYSKDTDFSAEIAASRTFGFLSEVERMRAMGLALGGSLENTVVLDGDTILNPEGLRFRDEFVRHKVLDALGDFSLSQYVLVGRVILHKAGHELQTRLIREILAQKDAYMITESIELTPEKEASGWSAFT